jgi:hypothetical protein
MIDKVGREVIALFRCLQRFHLVIVVDEIRVVLVRVAPKEAVIALEAATQGPPVVRSGRRSLIGRGQVPFAERVRVVAVL